MSTATATQSQPVALTGGAETGYKQRILAHCLDNGIEMTGAKARRLGQRMWLLAQKMQQEFDFYEALRILGMTTDTTARQAEHRATCRKLECDTCGRTSWKQHA